ncbi:uncharacterized protein [Anabrus simplex]|uniref:uncharacterized protein isoform X4 n=1 Tax=Anabrus simplex TaxID=316456 RepID=UPI0035A3286F
MTLMIYLLLYKMDQKMEIKEEPPWLEGTASTSFDNYEHTSAKMHLKEETKSELAELGETQLPTDIKDEIFVDELTCFKEEDKIENDAFLTRGPVDTCDSSCKVLNNEDELMCELAPQHVRDQLQLSQSGERPIRPIIRQLALCDVCGYFYHLNSSLSYSSAFIQLCSYNHFYMTPQLVLLTTLLLKYGSRKRVVLGSNKWM